MFGLYIYMRIYNADAYIRLVAIFEKAEQQPWYNDNGRGCYIKEVPNFLSLPRPSLTTMYNKMFMNKQK